MLPCQEIHLQGLDCDNLYKLESDSIDIYASVKSALDVQNVTASSKIKMQKVVKFHWDYNYRLQQLLCRHRFSPLMAYCIFNPGTPPSSNKAPTMVRLRYADTAKKCLLKSFFGKVVTMDFALSPTPVLAVLDESRTLRVFMLDITDVDDCEIPVTTLLLLQLGQVSAKLDLQLLSWCPWVSDCEPAVPFCYRKDGRDYHLPKDPAMLLAVSQQNKVMLMDVGSLPNRLQHYSSDKSPQTDAIWTYDDVFHVLIHDEDSNSIFTVTEDHPDNVTALQLSQDGSCFASACLDGNVRLFSIRSFANRSPSGNLIPIHIFSPHNGLPVYGLMFLDCSDPRDDTSSPTWSHLITGSKYNRELRLWCCSNWDCVQTIRFLVDDSSHKGTLDSDDSNRKLLSSYPKPHLLIGLDWSKKLLVITDITRRVLYILSIDVHSNGAPRFSSISEFLLTSPCVTFVVGSCEQKTLNNSNLHSVPVDFIDLEVHSVHPSCLMNNLITFELQHWPTTILDDYQIMEQIEPFNIDVNPEELEADQSIDHVLSNTFGSQTIPAPDFNGEPSNTNQDEVDGEIAGIDLKSLLPQTMPDVNSRDAEVEPEEQEQAEDGNHVDEEEEDLEYESLLRPSHFTSQPVPDEAGDRPSEDEEYERDLEPSSFPTFTRLDEINPPLAEEIDPEPYTKPTTDSPELNVYEMKAAKLFDLSDDLFGLDVLSTSRCSPQKQKVEQTDQRSTPNNVIPVNQEIVNPISDSSPKGVIPASIVKKVTNWSTMSVYSSSSRDGSDEVEDEPIDEKETATSCTHFPEDKEQFPVDRESIHHVLELLTALVGESKLRDNQIEHAVNQLNETQEQLQAMQRFQVDLVQRLDVDHPTRMLAPAHTQSDHSMSVHSDMNTNEKYPKWVEEILLQLRGQQGEFNSHFNKLEATVNKLVLANQKLQQKHQQPPKNPITVESLRPVLRAELQNAFTKNVQRFVDPLQKSIVLSIHDSLASVSANLPEDVSRVLRDKNFSTHLSRNLSSTLAADLGSAYRDSLQLVFVPALQRTISRLFDELHVIFRAGTQEYLEKLSQSNQTPIDTASLANAVCSQLLPELQKQLSSVSSSKLTGNALNNTSSTSVRSSPKLDPPPKRAQQIQSSNTSQMPQVQSNSGPTHNSSSMGHNLLNKSSWAVDRGAQESVDTTKQRPISTDKKEEFSLLVGQAQKLIREKRYVAALELALVSTNQPLLLVVCNDLNPQTLFMSGNHPMGQNILLSLIHQLTCGDFGAQIDLKLNYLQGAISTLDTTDRTAIEHGPAILALLIARLEAFLQNSSNADRLQNARKLSPFVQKRINQLIQSVKCLHF